MKSIYRWIGGRSDVTTPHWKQALEGQFLAAVDTLEDVMRACPPALWDDAAVPVERRFWYLAFHTLFWLDRYLETSPEAHRPPAPFTLDEIDPAGVYPDRTYRPEELLTYLAHGRAKARRVLAALDDTSAAAASGYHRGQLTFLELHLQSMRHVQHHASQLNLMLRQGGAEPARWVNRGGER